MFEKLKFWKKNEPFDYEKLESADYNKLESAHHEFEKDRTSGLAGTEELGQTPDFGETQLPEGTHYEGENITITGKGGLKPVNLEHQDDYSQQRGYETQKEKAYTPADMTSKDIEIISAKLDGIKAAIETINARLTSMENDIRRIGKGW